MSKKKNIKPVPLDLGQIVALIIPTNHVPEKEEAEYGLFEYVRNADFSTAVVIGHLTDQETGRISLYNGDTFPIQGVHLPINTELLDELCDEEDDFFAEDIGHTQNPAIIRMIGALLGLRDNVEVLPIIAGSKRLSIAEELGHALGEVMHNRHLLLVSAIEVEKVAQATLGAFIGSLETMQLNPLIRMVQSDEVKLKGGNVSFIGTLLAASRRGVKQAKVLTTANNQFMGAILYR